METRLPKTKRCAKCGKVRRRKSFIPNRARKDGLTVYCRYCHTKYNKRYKKSAAAIARADVWKLENPDRFKAAQLVGYLRRRTNQKDATVESVLLEIKKSYICPYCNSPLTWRNFSYDHKDGMGTDVHPVCTECNLLKHNFEHEDFLRIASLLGIERLKYYHSKLKRPYGKESYKNGA